MTHEELRMLCKQSLRLTDDNTALDYQIDALIAAGKMISRGLVMLYSMRIIPMTVSRSYCMSRVCIRLSRMPLLGHFIKSGWP